jgi:hypothetical protein
MGCRHPNSFIEAATLATAVSFLLGLRAYGITRVMSISSTFIGHPLRNEINIFGESVNKDRGRGVPAMKLRRKDPSAL